MLAATAGDFEYAALRRQDAPQYIEDRIAVAHNVWAVETRVGGLGHGVCVTARCGCCQEPYCPRAALPIATLPRALPTAAAHIASEAPEGRRGQYLGAYSMTFSVALMVGPWAGAIALGRFGATTLWLATLACGLCAAWITWAVSPGKAFR